MTFRDYISAAIARLPERQCSFCGGPFNPSTFNQATCSKECARLKHIQSVLENRRLNPPRRRKGRPRAVKNPQNWAGELQLRDPFELGSFEGLPGNSVEITPMG